MNTQGISLKKKLYPFWFLLPFFIIIFVFMVVPIIFYFIITFTDFDIRYTPAFVGLDNYQKIFRDPNFMQILGISFLFVLFALVMIMCMSIIISVLTQYFVKKEILRNAYRTVWLAMNALPSIIYAIVIKGMFSPVETGIVNAVCLRLGLIDDPVAWFNIMPLFLVIFTTGFLNGANGVIILSSAINSLPEDFYKAARVDGSSEVGIVFQIILPSLKWPIMYLVVTNAISLVASYNYILLLTEGGPNYATMTMSLYAYQTAFAGLDYGYGSAIAIIVVALSIGLVMSMFKLFNFDDMLRPPRIDD